MRVQYGIDMDQQSTEPNDRYERITSKEIQDLEQIKKSVTIINNRQAPSAEAHGNQKKNGSYAQSFSQLVNAQYQ